MKIAVSGVGGAGKSTLCKRIAQSTNVPLMPDWMDTVLEEMRVKSGKELAEKQGEPGVIAWYIRALERKVEEDKKWEQFITDKSVLDHGARWYARKFASATPEQYMQVEQLLNEGITVYDRIIFIPLNPLNMQTEDNALRVTDIKHRAIIDILTRGLAQKYNTDLDSYIFNFQDAPEKVLTDLGLDRAK